LGVVKEGTGVVDEQRIIKAKLILFPYYSFYREDIYFNLFFQFNQIVSNLFFNFKH